MANGISKKLMNIMNLNDDDYDTYDDLDDDELDDEPKPARKKKTNRPKFKKKAAPVVEDIIDIDEYDDDEYDDPVIDEEPVVTKKSNKKSGFGAKKRNTNLHSVPSRNSFSSMELVVHKPIDFDSSEDISLSLLDGKAVVINFELVTTAETQRIIDFVSGVCFSQNGAIRQITNNIVIVAPNNIDIAGDLSDLVESDVAVPSFNYDED